MSATCWPAPRLSGISAFITFARIGLLGVFLALLYLAAPPAAWAEEFLRWNQLGYARPDPKVARLLAQEDRAVQRCGDTNPALHGPCHLLDATRIEGGPDPAGSTLRLIRLP